MKHFLTALDVTPLDDGRNWRVVEWFFYDTAVKLSGPRPHTVVVNKGFKTDFASIPRWLWWLVGAPAEGKYRKIAVVHDKLYRTQGLATRREADAVLWEGMGVCRVNGLTRIQVYLGVRLFGWLSYQGGL